MKRKTSDSNKPNVSFYKKLDSVHKIDDKKIKMADTRFPMKYKKPNLSQSAFDQRMRNNQKQKGAFFIFFLIFTKKLLKKYIEI